MLFRSCVRDDGKSVEINLAGTVMGEDGKPGFQGRVVSKTGKVISQLVKVGAVETLAGIATGVANGVNINTGSGGSGGSPRTQINLGGTAAEAAGKAGLSVLLIEKNNLGGVCLNEGCIPTKTLLYSAKTYDSAKHASKYAINVSEVSFDLSRLLSVRAKWCVNWYWG